MLPKVIILIENITSQHIRSYVNGWMEKNQDINIVKVKITLAIAIMIIKLIQTKFYIETHYDTERVMSPITYGIYKHNSNIESNIQIR